MVDSVYQHMALCADTFMFNLREKSFQDEYVSIIVSYGNLNISISFKL